MILPQPAVPLNVSVIIPVYDERETILEVLRRVQATGLVQEILVVDDGSRDGTRELLKAIEGKDPGVRILLHPKNQGKGAAVRTGIQQASGEVILIQDADLEYDPRDYPALLQPLAEGTADVVYGSRFLGSRGREALFWSRVANAFLTLATNLLYGNTLSDMETGYKVFRRQVAAEIPLRARGFEFEPEFTAKLLKRRVRIREVPIHFNPRGYAEGKKIKPRDALIALWTLIRCRFRD